MTINPTHLNALLATLVSLVLVPAVIVVISFILSAANDSAGWLRYRLPGICFWTFLVAGFASPVVGVGTLLFLWTSRSALVDGQTREFKGRGTLVFAALLATMAPAVWTLAFAEVFFVAGGSR